MKTYWARIGYVLHPTLHPTGKRRFAIFLLLAGIILLFPNQAMAATSPSNAGAALFEAHCSGCHLKGGNILRRGKTLKLKALQRNHVDTLEAVTALVTHGKGNMSAYGEPQAPGEASRLTPEEIETVSRYVLDQAQTGWH